MDKPGCPLNNFGPCREKKCRFFVAYKEGPECIFGLGYLSSLDNGVWITALISKAFESGLLKPSSDLVSPKLSKGLPGFRRWVSHLFEQISKIRDLLKDIS